MGNWTHSSADIKNFILLHFTNLYTMDSICSLLNTPLLNIHIPSLNVDDPLLRGNSTLEIFFAINSFKPYKTPGPDDLHLIFFQRVWHILGSSISTFIKGIFTFRRILRDLSSTLICLIPKTSKPETVHQLPKTVHQLRLISLCNNLYKAITKILVCRLKPHLGDLIHPF